MVGTECLLCGTNQFADTSTALQTLVELGEDSIKIVESLSDKIHDNYATKLFLVQFLMGNMSSALSTESYQALSTREMGIKVRIIMLLSFFF